MRLITAHFTFAILISCLFGCQSSNKKTEEHRKPASAEDLFIGTEKVLQDLQNENVFNARTCASYINGVTDTLYGLKSDFFIPKNAQEVEAFKAKGVDLMKSIFQVRVLLRERFQQFDEKGELTTECMMKVREGIQYARFTEEYLLEWLVHNKVVDARTPNILAPDPIFTMTNPKFNGFKFKTGDLMIIRGKSYVSAMIARIGDEEGNFSHLAIVTEDKNGNQYVIESLIQKGLVITPLEKWVTAQDARVALYRQRDEELGRKAGRTMYDFTKAKLAQKGEVRYDFAMDDTDYSAFFCTEVGKFAYDKASDGKYVIPKFRSTVTKFKNSKYPRTLGVNQKTLFAPFDLEVDPRFDFVAEYKYYPLLRQVRMQDAVLQSVYEWMVKKGYEFHFALPITAKAYLGKALRQFGFVADVMPKYMPMQSIVTTAQFESVATALEKNLYVKEDQYYKDHGYLPSFKDFMEMNEDYRRQDCQKRQEYQKTRMTEKIPDMSKFHWFFRSNDLNCN